jgi:hypothetical protein
MLLLQCFLKTAVKTQLKSGVTETTVEKGVEKIFSPGAEDHSPTPQKRL